MKYERAPSFYKRYIDDGFGLWVHGEEELIKFKNFANGIHKNIQVELRWSKTKIEFLDTLVSLKDGRCITDLHVKPTDKHLYVNKESCHPAHVKRAVPYGLALRLKRICSEKEGYTNNRRMLKRQLRKRGYSGKFIEKQLKKADDADRGELLKKQNSKKKLERVPLVLTYGKQLPNIHDIVKKRLRTLHKSDRMRRIFGEPPLVAYRRDRNLCDILVHGKLNRVMNEKRNDGSCKDECVVCCMMGRHMKVFDKNKIEKNELGCSTHNVVYGIGCRTCRKVVYVGETSRTVKDRIKEHEADVRLKRKKPVADHFNGKNHDIEDMTVTVLEKIMDKGKYYRQMKELEWIKKLETEAPNGINVKTGLSVLWREYK
jgi:hypothetical protein